MTTMQAMSCMMLHSASATTADAAISCACATGMQSASFGMIMMGAMIMASIIILSVLVNGLVVGNLHMVTLLALVLLGVIVEKKYFTRP